MIETIQADDLLDLMKSGDPPSPDEMQFALILEEAGADNKIILKFAFERDIIPEFLEKYDGMCAADPRTFADEAILRLGEALRGDMVNIERSEGADVDTQMFRRARFCAQIILHEARDPAYPWATVASIGAHIDVDDEGTHSMMLMRGATPGSEAHFGVALN